ncbi:hypothetical protein [Shivajiella indica]|uniref:Uncharacterized protein n=1 Tax=Shivajiella indica TaxID=872115 RepID=A0ABW5BAG9_9BACT
MSIRQSGEKGGEISIANQEWLVEFKQMLHDLKEEGIDAII